MPINNEKNVIYRHFKYMYMSRLATPFRDLEINKCFTPFLTFKQIYFYGI